MAKPVVLRFLADTKQLDTAWRRIQADAAKTSGALSSMTKFSKGMVVTGRTLSRWVTFPIAAAGVAATKLAYDFEASMNHIDALVGASKAQMAKYRAAVLSLAPAVGKGPKELADALYYVTSSGFRGAKALSVLRASAKASAAGLGETQTVADAVTSAMNAYGSKVLKASQATDVLVATVREGKAEPDKLAQEIGKVIAPAALLKVKFNQVGAAIASMTNVGLNAAESTTALRQIFVTMIHPAKQTADQMKKIGLSAKGLRQEIKEKGLLATFQTLADKAKGNKEIFGKLFPNVRALTGFLAMMGPHAKKTAETFKALSRSTGDTDTALRKASDTAQHKWMVALAELKVVAIRAGTALLPFFEKFVGWVAKLAKKFDELSPKTKHQIGVFLALAAATGPVIYAMGKIGLAFTAMAKHPIITILILAAQAFIYLWTTSEKFRNGVRAVGAALVSFGGWVQKNQAWLMALGATFATFTAVLLIQKGVVAAYVGITKAWTAATLLARGAMLSARIAMWLLNAAFVANPIGIVIAALVALGVGFVILWKKSETFRNIVKGVWSAVQRATGNAVGMMIRAFKGLLDMWLTVADGIISGAAKALGWIPGLGGKLKKANEAFDRMRAGIDKTLSGLADSAFGWGEDVSSGLSAGIIAKSGAPIAAARGVANKVNAAARAGFNSHSPSRVMIAIGKDVSAGLGIGISDGTAGVVATVSKQVSELKKKYRTELRQAIDAKDAYRTQRSQAREAERKLAALKRSGGSKSEVSAAARAAKEQERQRDKALRYYREQNGQAKSALKALRQQVAYEKDLNSRRRKGKPMLAQALNVTTGISDVIDLGTSPVTKMANDLAAQLQKQFADKDGKVPTAVTNAMNRLKDLAARVADFHKSFVGQFSDSGNFIGKFMGSSAGTGDMKAFLGSQISKLKRLGDDLKILVKRGLPPALLKQLAAGGLDALPMADSLARASNTDFTEILKLQSQLDALAQSTSATVEASVFSPQPARKSGFLAGEPNGGLTINVEAKTDASAKDISDEIAWQLKTVGY